MKPGKKIALVTAAALIPTMVLAAGWVIPNRATVYQVKGGLMEVVGRVGAGAQDYWCGAGDFAISALGTSATQRIYIWKALGPSTVVQGKKAVQFGLTIPPEGEAPQSYSLSVKTVGDSIPASMARNYCFQGRLVDF